MTEPRAMCPVTWNPGTWPYTTRCVLSPGHKADHEDRVGRTIPNVPGQEQAAQ